MYFPNHFEDSSDVCYKRSINLPARFFLFKLNNALRRLSLSLSFNWDTVRFNGALGPDLPPRERKILRTLCAVYKSVLWTERINARAIDYRIYNPDTAVLDDKIAWKAQEILSIN